MYQLKGKSEDLDGVMVFNPEGKPLAFIRLPERCANLCFGGPKNNRLYMAAATRSTRSMWRRTARCGWLTLIRLRNVVVQRKRCPAGTTVSACRV